MNPALLTLAILSLNACKAPQVRDMPQYRLVIYDPKLIDGKYYWNVVCAVRGYGATSNTSFGAKYMEYKEGGKIIQVPKKFIQVPDHYCKTIIGVQQKRWYPQLLLDAEEVLEWINDQK